eukprot:5393035-Heterocapsa_arctica.AAC.1
MKANICVEQPKQTKLGEEQTTTHYFGNQEKLGPKEEGTNQRDCAAGRLFNGEREDGAIITSTNLSGSQFDYECMLEHCKDHISLIQEHWRLT